MRVCKIMRIEEFFKVRKWDLKKINKNIKQQQQKFKAEQW